MSEYIITKWTECGWCHKTAYSLVTCRHCNDTGYAGTVVDADEWLLDRLAKLRWDAPLPGYDEVVETKEMTNPRFEENK